MGVTEIYDFLKENRGFHTAKELSEKLGYNVRSIRKSLNTVVRYGDIECKYDHIIRETIQKSVGLKTRKAWLYGYAKNGGDKIGRENI